jgi:hypothetical protein
MARPDVGISYIDKRDGSIAVDLGNAVESEGYVSFVARQRQEELIGDNGSNRFRRVFGWEARVVIVLYRDSWGKTPFTKVESDAIRVRRWFDRRPFLKMIRMDNSPLPPWYPEKYIYGRFEELGVEGIAGTASFHVRKFRESSARRARVARGMIAAATGGAVYIAASGVGVHRPQLVNPPAPRIFVERHWPMELPRIPDELPEAEPPQLVRHNPSPSPLDLPAPPPVESPPIRQTPARLPHNVATELAAGVAPVMGLGGLGTLAPPPTIANFPSPGPFPLKYSGKDGLLSISGGRVEFAAYRRARSFSAGCGEIRSTSVISNRPQTKLQIVVDHGKFEMTDATSETADKALDAIIRHCRSFKG